MAAHQGRRASDSHERGLIHCPAHSTRASCTPSLGMRVFPIAAGVGILGAIATIPWLLIVGVNEQRWMERANLTAASIWR